jgi:sulfate adenylyltransferase subunit 1 (EFTu-like GTPase family)
MRTSSPVVIDDYNVDRTTGAFVLVDEATGATVDAGMVGSTLGGRD